MLGLAPTAGFKGIEGFGLAAGACALAPMTEVAWELAGVEEGNEEPDIAFLLCHDEGADEPLDVPCMERAGARGAPGAAGGARRATGGGGGGAARCSMSLRLQAKRQISDKQSLRGVLRTSSMVPILRNRP